MKCSFCGKRQDQVWRMVAGPGVYICGECIAVSMQIVVASGPSGRSLRVGSRQPDGTVQRSEHGPLPEVGLADQARHRWLRQCRHCGAWTVGEAEQACLECGKELV